jgi:hypothetical protein
MNVRRERVEKPSLAGANGVHAASLSLGTQLASRFIRGHRASCRVERDITSAELERQLHARLGIEAPQSLRLFGTQLVGDRHNDECSLAGPDGQLIAVHAGFLRLRPAGGTGLGRGGHGCRPDGLGDDRGVEAVLPPFPQTASGARFRRKHSTAGKAARSGSTRPWRSRRPLAPRRVRCLSHARCSPSLSYGGGQYLGQLGKVCSASLRSRNAARVVTRPPNFCSLRFRIAPWRAPTLPYSRCAGAVCIAQSPARVRLGPRCSAQRAAAISRKL